MLAQPDIFVTGDMVFHTEEIREHFAVYTPADFLRDFYIKHQSPRRDWRGLWLGSDPREISANYRLSAEFCQIAGGTPLEMLSH